MERWQKGDLRFDHVEVDAFEIDQLLHQHLSSTLNHYASGRVVINIRGEDFIKAAVDSTIGNLFSAPLQPYSHAILNPPYKKIRSNSPHRLALREVGIETVNLYSAFVALAIAKSIRGGHVIAIIPRSFCNGPYYRPFREYVLVNTAIRRIHLFESRTRAFKDDGVLQENIIIHLERGARQGRVIVSTSTDDTFSDLSMVELDFDRIVFPDDKERFIHIPTTKSKSGLERHLGVFQSIDSLGIQVSTGPVVDFRLREHLRSLPDDTAVPLLYPNHLRIWDINWPLSSSKKPNAISKNETTARWLYENGYYCVVRRLSSKEEKRRVVASIVEPSRFRSNNEIGFENHLNVFHRQKKGLPANLAYGLVAFLNSEIVDEHFRRFSGHTQVNATDLKLLKYPNLQVLSSLGEWAQKTVPEESTVIDEKLNELLNEFQEKTSTSKGS